MPLGAKIMVRILIVYDSKTGNTETMALAVAKGAEQVGGVDVTRKKVGQTRLDDLLAADGIIMVRQPIMGRCQPNSKP